MLGCYFLKHTHNSVLFLGTPRFSLECLLFLSHWQVSVTLSVPRQVSGTGRGAGGGCGPMWGHRRVEPPSPAPRSLHSHTPRDQESVGNQTEVRLKKPAQ